MILLLVEMMNQSLGTCPNFGVHFRSRPEERIKASQTALMIESILRCLGAREKEIVMRRFGLITGREETLQEISDSLQVSRERVRQIEKASIKKLKSISLQSPEIIMGLDVQERSKTYH
jgi:RNA polymerase sigma factor (sigma-70 family)